MGWIRLIVALGATGCGTLVDLGGIGGTDASVDVTSCGSLISPMTQADCHACNKDASDCQSNGCYGGYWCDVDAGDCRAPPSTCP